MNSSTARFTPPPSSMVSELQAERPLTTSQRIWQSMLRISPKIPSSTLLRPLCHPRSLEGMFSVFILFYIYWNVNSCLYRESDFFSKLVVDALLRVKTVNSKGEAKYPVKAINILKSHGKSARENIFSHFLYFTCNMFFHV